MKALIFIIGTIAVIVIETLGLMWAAYVFMKVWEWFIAPYFVVNPIPIRVSAGLILAASILVQSNHPKPKDDRPSGEYLGKYVRNIILIPSIILMVAFIVKIWP